MDKLIEHEDWQGKDYLDFLKAFWMRRQKTAFPIKANAKNQVETTINEGRYIVSCPNNCGGATIISSKQMFFICVRCGSPENDGQFYNVRFPQEKVKIEELLLKRPLINRNWAKETVAELENENRAKGVK